MASDQMIAALAKSMKEQGVSLGTPDNLPYIFGNTDQTVEYLKRVGEWESVEGAKLDGKLTDDYKSWFGSGIGYNPREAAEDGSFLDIYGMRSPSGLGYLGLPFIQIFDWARRNKISGPSPEVVEAVNIPLSAYRKQIEEHEMAKFLAETQRIDVMARRYEARTKLLQAAAVQP